MTSDEIPDKFYAEEASYVLNLFGNSLVVNMDSLEYFSVLGSSLSPRSPPPEESSTASPSVPRSPETTPPATPLSTPRQANKEETRKVEMPTFKSRRAELLEANKPVYNYYPAILQEYTPNDFLKHMAIFPKASKEDKKASQDQPGCSTSKDRQSRFLTTNAAALKEQIKAVHLKDWWYLVVDTKILLEDMFFVEKLVKSDKDCRLHLPYEVFHDLTALSAKHMPARMRMPARRVIQFHNRLLKYGKGQGAIEAEDVLDSPVAYDSVINCCMQLMRRYYYVVLITNDPERKTRADSICLPCYNLDEVKELTAIEALIVTINNKS